MKRAFRLTEAEWEVMTVAWQQAPVAASAIAEILEKRRNWSLATVRTLLRRLVNKGALDQEIDGKRYLYRPKVSLDECARRETDSLWDRVLGRAPAVTLLNLVRRADLSATDIEELRRILKEKEKSS